MLTHVLIQAQTADETAIREVIEGETQAFVNMPFADVVKKFWVLDHKTLINSTNAQGGHGQVPLADMLSQTDVPPPNHAEVVKSDFVFVINGNMAVVRNKQVVTIAEMNFVQNSIELRFLEKVDGVWKIHLSSVHQFE
jgi:hypothetical protein